MLVELGNAHPKNASHTDASVTYVNVAHTNVDDYSIDVSSLKNHLFEKAIGAGDTYAVHNFAGSETLTELFNPVGGLWAEHSFDSSPSWVACDEDPDLANFISAYTGCPVGRPTDVQETHYTNAGAPGVMMSPGPTALVVNNGLDILSRMIGGLTVGFNKATATAAGTTSLTATGTPFVSSAYIGNTVVDLSTGVYGVISANTTSVLTVDRWYNPATPGGAAGTTPGNTDTYCILGGSVPAWFMGISTTNTASVSTDTTMAGEITTASGGCLRTLATYAHSTGTTTYTLSNTFTTNSNDTGSLPYAVARDGIFTSIVTGGVTTMMVETLLNAIATLALTGDAVTITHTFTV
jgi:hypothetical protein